MKVTPFKKYPNYIIKTDVYPYTEAREIVKSVEWWWDHESRSIKNENNYNSNYALDPNLRNSLEKSFMTRLHGGNFSFLYYKDELLLYAGLRVDEENNAWAHRAASNPVTGKHHVGMATAIMIPYQIKCAYEMGCNSFCMSFNEKRYKWYEWFKDKHYLRGKVNVQGGEELVSKFEFLGKHIIFETEQYLCKLDLKREDIHEFLPT